MSAFSGGWGIIINHKSHSTLSLNYTEGSCNSASQSSSSSIPAEALKRKSVHCEIISIGKSRDEKRKDKRKKKREKKRREQWIRPPKGNHVPDWLRDQFDCADALWFKTAMSRDVSTGPLARPFARSLALLTRLLALPCSLRSRAPLRSLGRLLTLLTPSLVGQ